MINYFKKRVFVSSGSTGVMPQTRVKAASLKTQVSALLALAVLCRTVVCMRCPAAAVCWRWSWLPAWWLPLAWVVAGVAVLSPGALPQAPCSPLRHGIPPASSAHGSPWCGHIPFGFALVRALPPGREMPARGLHLGCWLLPWSPAVWAIFACCWLIYALIKSSGNLWVNGKIGNVTQTKL